MGKYRIVADFEANSDLQANIILDDVRDLLEKDQNDAPADGIFKVSGVKLEKKSWV